MKYFACSGANTKQLVIQIRELFGSQKGELKIGRRQGGDTLTSTL